MSRTRWITGSIWVAALAVAAQACGGGAIPSTGVGIAVSCSGAACGQTGKLIRRVEHCGGAVVHQDGQANATLESNGLGSEVFGVPAGAWCVDAFLDRDGDEQPTAGDVVPSSGEMPVTVSPETISFEIVVLGTSL